MATSSTGKPSPHITTGEPTCASGTGRKSTVSMSIETRPTVRVRAPETSTGVPDGAWRG